MLRLMITWQCTCMTGVMESTAHIPARQTGIIRRSDSDTQLSCHNRMTVNTAQIYLIQLDVRLAADSH